MNKVRALIVASTTALTILTGIAADRLWNGRWFWKNSACAGIGECIRNSCTQQMQCSGNCKCINNICQ